jgi:hypothetical protein
VVRRTSPVMMIAPCYNPGMSELTVPFTIRFLGLRENDRLLKRRHLLIINPFRRRLDLGGRFVSCIFSPASVCRRRGLVGDDV